MELRLEELLNGLEQAIEGYKTTTTFFKLTVSKPSLQAKKRRLLKKINNGYTVAIVKSQYLDIEHMVTLRVIKFI